MVTGDDLNQGQGGVLPGVTYWFEVQFITKDSVKIDDNDGKCYSVTVPK